MPHVSVGGTRVHYLEHGHGPAPVVLLGGFISTHRWWRPFLEHFDSERYTCYALDLRGTGDSDPTDEGHTFAQYLADVEAVVDAIGLDRFAFVAHSMGAGVAMPYALSHPERLSALFLANPLSPRGTQHLTPEVVEAINGMCGSEEGVRAIIIGGFVTPPADDEYLAELIRDGLGWGPAIYRGTMDEMGGYDITADLARMQTPTLVLWGDGDTVIPFDGIVSIFTDVPGCGLEVWHGVGHDTILEAPDRVAALADR
ncbi:MAG TPA: alpha/beta hydrolase, partial [Candidatus Limnocylindrales bacterium]|nr:alpha/beta hydrolase [Candidatus Limnocylindrales bacterium]